MYDLAIGLLSGILSGVLVSFAFYLLALRGSRKQLEELRVEFTEIRTLVVRVFKLLRDAQIEPIFKDNELVGLNYRLNTKPGKITMEGGVVHFEHRDKDGNLVNRRKPEPPTE